MQKAAPYRASRVAPERFLPSLVWTRRAALLFALLGGAPSVAVVRHLLLDRDCDRQATPHLALALLVVVLAAGAGLASTRLQPHVIRAAARPVRSRLGGAVLATLALLPPLLFVLASVAAAVAIDFFATFRFCFSADVASAFFPHGC
ncbi:MAG TPA: hypothetical protein VGH28_07955 [Polyangiaceae bacterium]